MPRELIIELVARISQVLDSRSEPSKGPVARPVKGHWRCPGAEVLTMYREIARKIKIASY